MLPDLTDRADVIRLVDAFYARVRVDALLSPIFEDVAGVNWAQHLPRMYDFWDSVMFGRTAFKGNPLVVHRDLARRASLTTAEFDRWLELFHGAVDALFAGPFAEEAKSRASRIAVVMQGHIAGDPDRSPSADESAPNPDVPATHSRDIELRDKPSH